MEYTEEELKAINFFKKYNWYADINEEHDNIDILFNLIEKQQKEIEKKDKRLKRQFKLLQKRDKEIEILKKESTKWIDNWLEENEKWQKERNENGRLKRQIKNSIPKEVIREKIEEIQNELDEKYSAEKISIFSGNTYMEKFKLLGKLCGLKELLGE